METFIYQCIPPSLLLIKFRKIQNIYIIDFPKQYLQQLYELQIQIYLRELFLRLLQQNKKKTKVKNIQNTKKYNNNTKLSYLSIYIYSH